jgi:hypothetical protein
MDNASYFGYALNTVGAAAADFSVVDGVVTLTGVGSFPYDKIQTQIKKQIYVAPIARATVITFSAPAAAGEEFNVTISQPQGSNNVFPQLFSLKSTNTNATTIAQAFKAAFENAVNNGVLFGTASGAADAITITGTTAFPMLRVLGTTANISLSVTAAGNPAINTGAQLISAGVEGAVATNNYTTFTFQNATPTGDIVEDGIARQLIYAVNEGDGNAAALVTAMTNVLSGGLSNSPLVANPELIGKLSS